MKKLIVISALLVAGAMMFAADTKAASTDTKAAATTTTAATTDTKAAAPVATTLEGTVAKTVAANTAKKTPAEIVVIGADGKDNTFVVKANAAITGADGKAIKLAQVTAKSKVKVTFAAAGKAQEASAIELLK